MKSASIFCFFQYPITRLIELRWLGESRKLKTNTSKQAATTFSEHLLAIR